MCFAGFGHMTQQLMTLADRKVALILEGGYEVEPLCDSAEACLRALLNEKVCISYRLFGQFCFDTCVVAYVLFMCLVNFQC